MKRERTNFSSQWPAGVRSIRGTASKDPSLCVLSSAVSGFPCNTSPIVTVCFSSGSAQTQEMTVPARDAVGADWSMLIMGTGAARCLAVKLSACLLLGPLM